MKNLYLCASLMVALIMSACSAGKTLHSDNQIKGKRDLASVVKKCECRDDIYTGHWYKSATVNFDEACRRANPEYANRNIVADQCDGNECECRDDIYTGSWYKSAKIDFNQLCRDANPEHANRNIVAVCQ